MNLERNRAKEIKEFIYFQYAHPHDRHYALPLSRISSGIELEGGTSRRKSSLGVSILQWRMKICSFLFRIDVLTFGYSKISKFE